MNNLIELINEIKQSQSKGQEQLIDQFLVGYLIGTGEIKSIEDIRLLTKQLSAIKQQMDDNDISSFSRDYFINQKLNGFDASQVKKQTQIQQTKKQIKQQSIKQNDQLEIDKNDNQTIKEKVMQQKQQDNQDLVQNVDCTKEQQIEGVQERNQTFLKQSQKQYNARLQKVVQDAKNNQKQN